MIDRKLLKFTEECLNLNRTIVSKDNSKILKKIILILKSGYKVHKFPSGNTYGTWEIPNHGMLNMVNYSIYQKIK